MQRSSETIANLAAALAKAQVELVNPEKSLVARIKSDRPGEPERSFRYAPLSAGLEIVRKTLGQHEIATVQTTSVDQTSGIVNLTTVLAHVSGEWIASDWPVCAIDEAATPHRMGSALTYARRYALFTLVGIAGEDDIDAPDLTTPTRTLRSEKPKGNRNGRINNRQYDPAQSGAIRDAGKIQPYSGAPTLEPEASAQLRDQLVNELSDLGSDDDAAVWAHRCLGEKDRLTAADSRLVEQAFRARLATFVAPGADAYLPAKAELPTVEQNSDLEARQSKSHREVIDKSVLPLPEPRRVRDRAHIKTVAKQPCLICGRRPSDAHHLRFAQHPALGRKASDEFTVPLCRGHHREVHRCGDEAAWWQTAGIDPAASARALWLLTHPISMSPETIS